jgi:hypothetical protein
MGCGLIGACACAAENAKANIAAIDAARIISFELPMFRVPFLR